MAKKKKKWIKIDINLEEKHPFLFTYLRQKMLKSLRDAPNDLFRKA